MVPPLRTETESGNVYKQDTTSLFHAKTKNKNTSKQQQTKNNKQT